MKKQTAPCFSGWLTATFFTLLALALGESSANAGTATWSGRGDGTNWSDMANWKDADGNWVTGDPMLNPSDVYLYHGDALTTDSTVDVNTTTWGFNGGTTKIFLSTTNVLNIPTDGYLKCERTFNPLGSTINLNGGWFGDNLRPNSFTGNASGVVNVSAGTLALARITYIKTGTLNIVGSAPTSVQVNDFYSWMNASAPILGFTLDAGGVSPLKFNTHSNDSNVDGNVPAPVTFNVSGIAAYAAGPRPLGDSFYLAKDLNSNLVHPSAWPDNELVDGGFGRLDRVADGVKLTILNPSTSIFQITKIVRNPGTGAVTLTFPSTTETTYTIEATTDLTPSSWEELDDNWPGQADETDFTDTIFAPAPAPPGRNQVFYRVTKNP